MKWVYILIALYAYVWDLPVESLTVRYRYFVQKSIDAVSTTATYIHEPSIILKLQVAC